MSNATQRQKELIELANATFSKRAPLLTLWQEIADNFYPERANFTSTLPLGTDFCAHLMEGFPVMMRRELGNTFSSYLRPRGQEWFEGGPASEKLKNRPDCREASQRISAIMRSKMYHHRAMFPRATKECDHDFAAFGQGVISLQERRDRNGILYQNWHLKDVAWNDNDEGQTDQVFRRYCLSLRNAMQRYGDAMHQSWKTMADQAQNMNKDVPLMHIVVPWLDYGEKVNGKKPKRDIEASSYVSMIVDPANVCVLNVKLIRWMPYVVPRWATVSDSQYAFSPAASLGLPDARLIQRQALTILEAGEKAVDPPLIATEGSIQGEVNIAAGQVTWVDAAYDERMGAALRPMDLAKNPGLGIEMKKDTRELLLQAFFLNKLQLPDTRDMTAYEAKLRTQEYIRAAMPIFESIEASYNAPLLDLTFTLLEHTGAFEGVEIPKDMQDEEVEFSFENPLQETYRRQRAQMFQEGMGIVGAAAQADQSALKIVRVPQATRSALEAAGWPEEWMADMEQTEQVEEGAQLDQDIAGVSGAVQQGAGAAQGIAGAAQAIQSLMGGQQAPGAA